jgi:hypothetical protein
MVHSLNHVSVFPLLEELVFRESEFFLSFSNSLIEFLVKVITKEYIFNRRKAVISGVRMK